MKRLLFASCIVAAMSCQQQYEKIPEQACMTAERNPALAAIDSLEASLKWPTELKITGFAGPDVVPSPACLAVAAEGDVFVGVDMIGSLGKTPNRGRIIKITDCNNDGIADRITEFAKVDNPRGIIAMGTKVYVLHTVFTDTLATGMDLVVFEDKDNDGVADGPSTPLIQHISNPAFLQSRGTDHATNGIRMGIDGWIYISVGDFGFHDAVDREGKKLTMLGGGIVRVRPDGTEMEEYTHGLRNIYDVAIDPLMNMFTLDNTNDGGGWNIRFSHQLQYGEYGYPVLFKHFTEEIIPAMVDLGGGSGTGVLFMDDDTWPARYNNVPMMGDWGRSQLFLNRVTPVGASYTQEQEEFIKMPQITDVDVDASGRMYISAWDGAGYSGDSTKGFVVRVVPQNWSYKHFGIADNLSDEALSKLLHHGSGVARLRAQQVLLNRAPSFAAREGYIMAADVSLPLHLRVAGIYTYVQGAGEKGLKKMLDLAKDEAIKEHVLRAVTDRADWLKNIPENIFVEALTHSNPRVVVAAINALHRLQKKNTATALLNIKVPASFVPPAAGTEGPHATPNTDIIPAHLAVKALVGLDAVEECVAAIGTPSSTLALWALRYMYSPKAVEGLIAAYDKTQETTLKKDILTTIARLYMQEAPYDGSWWWGTRPDTHGPFYRPVTWASSPAIQQFLEKEWALAKEEDKSFYTEMNKKLRMGIVAFGGSQHTESVVETKIDLEKIRNRKGQIGQTSIEDVMLAMEKIPGNAADGKRIYLQQGCAACHSVEKGEPLKGPFMGQIGSIMNRQQIAESILKPNASISQGFATVLISTKQGKSLMGFVTSESAEQLVLRDITGTSTTVKIADVASRKEMEHSMMPEGLANALSFEEFASLITWLFQQKG